MPTIDPKLINVTTAGSQHYPVASQNTFGEVAILWSQEKLNGVRDYDQAILRLYDSTGKPVTGEIQLDDPASGIYAYEARGDRAILEAQKDGTFIAGFVGYTLAGTSKIYEYYLCRIDRDGSVLFGPLAISDDSLIIKFHRTATQSRQTPPMSLWLASTTTQIRPQPRCPGTGPISSNWT